MILRWRNGTSLPVETERLTPEAFLGLSAIEAARRTAHVGNRRVELGDVLEAEDDGSEVLTLEGDLRHVRGIGRGMTSGRVVVRGTAGADLGAGMSGGEVEVFGDVGDRAGLGMSGGTIRVRGNAGRALGGATPGSRLGMRDGVILVDGSAAGECGERMRRGLIAVKGSVGEGFGRGMIAGSLFAFGAVGRHPGTGMKRGTIALFGTDPTALLPSFEATGSYRFPFLSLYLRRLAVWGFDEAEEVRSVALSRYNGDVADGGLGEILVAGGTDRR